METKEKRIPSWKTQSPTSKNSLPSWKKKTNLFSSDIIYSAERSNILHKQEPKILKGQNLPYKNCCQWTLIAIPDQRRVCGFYILRVQAERETETEKETSTEGSARGIGLEKRNTLSLWNLRGFLYRHHYLSPPLAVIYFSPLLADSVFCFPLW